MKSGLGSLKKSGKYTYFWMIPFIDLIPHCFYNLNGHFIAVLFEDVPMISYDSGSNGWFQIYNGILSPFATKYKIYIKSELKNRKLND